MKIYQILRKAREAAGLTQAKAAQDSGLSTPQFLSNIERGICLPSFPVLKSMCVNYNIDYQETAAKVIEEIQSRNLKKLSKRYKVK